MSVNVGIVRAAKPSSSRSPVKIVNEINEDILAYSSETLEGSIKVLFHSYTIKRTSNSTGSWIQNERLDPKVEIDGI